MQNITKQHNTHAGFTIVELIAAIMVVSLCIVAFAKIVHLAGQQRELGREHQTAVDQTLNVLEHLVAADPEQLATGEIDLTPHETLIAQVLPGGKLLVTCETLEVEHVDVATVDIWRLDASVSWSPGTNLPRRSVTITRLLSKPRPVIESPPEPETVPENEPSTGVTTEDTVETATGNTEEVTGNAEETAAGNVSDRIETLPTETTPEGGVE